MNYYDKSMYCMPSLANYMSEQDDELMLDFADIVEAVGYDKEEYLSNLERYINGDEYRFKIVFAICASIVNSLEGSEEDENGIVCVKHSFRNDNNELLNNLSDVINYLQPRYDESGKIYLGTFQIKVRQIINKRNSNPDWVLKHGTLTYEEVMKRANKAGALKKDDERRLMKENYLTQKKVWALIMALECDMKETIDLLDAAGMGFATVKDVKNIRGLYGKFYEVEGVTYAVTDPYDLLCMDHIVKQEYNIKIINQKDKEKSGEKAIYNVPANGIYKGPFQRKVYEIIYDRKMHLKWIKENGGPLDDEAVVRIAKKNIRMPDDCYDDLMRRNDLQDIKVWQLIMGLVCNEKEAIDLLYAAGMGLPKKESAQKLTGAPFVVDDETYMVTKPLDVVCLLCIQEREYNITKINSMLADRGVKKRMRAEKGVVSESEEDAICDFLRKSVYPPTQMGEIIDHLLGNGLIPLKTLQRMLTNEDFEAYSDRNSRG